MADLRLGGCKTRPLGSYLKALGVLRLVGKQLDPHATGRWEHDVFILNTREDEDRVLEFFLNDYHPTPIVTPWNGRSGFNTERRRKSEQILERVEMSKDERFTGFRDAIRVGREVYERAHSEKWPKDRWVQACRAVLPDEAVRWLDAIAVLTEEDVSYPFLLGTGGNLGSMDLSNNFMERVGEALGISLAGQAPKDALRAAWLRSALFGDTAPELSSAAPGQFDPGGKARGLVNPWVFVLTIEGSLLFASGAARRMGGSRGTVAMPFMVANSPVGFASSAAEERGRGEIWAPVWRSPVTHAELARVIGEGRSTWDRSQARTGLDFARAAASLGVDRGIDSFARYSFLERDGQDMIAVPTGGVGVKARPEVPLLSTIDRWASGVRRIREVPNGIRLSLRRLDDVQFELATRGGPERLQRVLAEVADLEARVARSERLRGKEVRSPIRRLRASQWLPLLDDGSPELRVAAALASQGDDISGEPTALALTASRMALLLRAVKLSPKRVLEWTESTARAPGLGVRDLTGVLADALRRRVIDVMAKNRGGRAVGEQGQVGVEPAFDFALPAFPGDVIAFISGGLDDAKVEDLLRACLLLDWSDGQARFQPPKNSGGGPPSPPAWAVVAPFFSRGRQAAGGPVLRADPAWPQLLISGRVSDVVDGALHRLRVARLDPAPRNSRVMAAGIDGRRLAAALLIPISTSARAALLKSVSPTELTEMIKSNTK